MTSEILDRPVWRSISRGFGMRCPACGRGKIFHAYLKVASNCEHCGLNLSGHEADDAPPYFTIFIVGHVVIPVALFVERFYAPPLWAHAILFSIIAFGVALVSLPRVKGAVIGWQWALRMHGFDDQHETGAET